MAKIKGMCRNEECDMCDQIQEAEKSNFKCEKCGKDLIPFGNKTSKSGNKGGTNVKLISIIIAALIALGGIGFGVYKLVNGGETNPTAIKLAKSEITMKVGETTVITPIVEPEDAKATFSFKLSKDGIASFSEKGVITALKGGEIQIYVTCIENPELKAICKIEVVENKDSIPQKVDTTVVTPPTNETPKVEPKKTETKPVKTTPTEILNGLGTKVLSYGKYSGNLKNGQPDGTGKLTFTRAYQLNADYTAQPGEYITGVFENGKPSFVTYYQKDGTVVKIKLR